jgi:hypothetical protein
MTTGQAHDTAALAAEVANLRLLVDALIAGFELIGQARGAQHELSAAAPGSYEAAAAVQARRRQIHAVAAADGAR